MSLIDADKLVELIDDDIASLDKNMSQEGYDVCLCTLQMAKLYILALPTVDAEPIKHGRWIEIEDGEEPFYFRCSECNRRSDFKEHYCPHCGARMDLIGEDKSHPFAESVMMGMDEVEE